MIQKYNDIFQVLPVEGLKAVSGIAWDSSMNVIFWSDVEKKAIYKAFWNGSNQEAIVETNLGTDISKFSKSTLNVS